MHRWQISIYKAVIWVFFEIRLWKEKEALNSSIVFIPWLYFLLAVIFIHKFMIYKPMEEEWRINI